MRIFKFITLPLLIVFSGGCATTLVHTSIDSLSSKLNHGKSYVLFSGMEDVKPTDLQFMEFASYTEKVLAEQGYFHAESEKDADIAIFLSYGISDPQDNTYTYAVPIWGQTGYSSAHTSGSINSYGNYASYNNTTTLSPTYGVTGYNTGMSTYTTFTRFIVLNAYDLKKYKESNEEVNLWKTIFVSTGESGDLRQIFPVMLVSGKEFIGKNTKKSILVKMPLEDKKVLELFDE